MVSLYAKVNIIHFVDLINESEFCHMPLLFKCKKLKAEIDAGKSNENINLVSQLWKDY